MSALLKMLLGKYFSKVTTYAALAFTLAGSLSGVLTTVADSLHSLGLDPFSLKVAGIVVLITRFKGVMGEVLAAVNGTAVPKAEADVAKLAATKS